MNTFWIALCKLKLVSRQLHTSSFIVCMCDWYISKVGLGLHKFKLTSSFLTALVFCDCCVASLMRSERESTKWKAAVSCESVRTHSRSSISRTKRHPTTEQSSRKGDQQNIFTSYFNQLKTKHNMTTQFEKETICSSFMIIFFLPVSFFLMVMRQRAWLVMSRSGVSAASLVERASTRSVCQESCTPKHTHT